MRAVALAPSEQELTAPWVVAEVVQAQYQAPKVEMAGLAVVGELMAAVAATGLEMEHPQTLPLVEAEVAAPVWVAPFSMRAETSLFPTPRSSTTKPLEA